MKKALKILFLVLTMAVCILTSQALAAGDGITLELGTVTASITDTEVKVPITLKENAGFGTLDISINWDPEVFELKEIELESWIPDNGSKPVSQSYSTGKYKMSLGDALSSKDFTETGLLGNIVFSIVDGAGAGQYPITVTRSEAYDAQLREVAVHTKNSTITIGEPISYTVSLDTAITNGTVSVDKTSAAKGTVITVSAVPDAGYEADGVTVTDRTGKSVSVNDNGNGTYSFVMPDSAVTVNVSFKKSGGGDEPAHDCPSKDFIDFDPNAWYHESVDYAVANGLMKGTSPITFEPGTTTTRAMIVTILWRLEGEPTVNAVNPFDDVVNGAWYTDAIVWAAANGIVEGYGEGKFGPNGEITREQLATMLYRYAKYKGYDVSAAANLNGYTDAGSISSWALAAIKWANAEGLVNGRTATTIVPQGKANRAETAAIFMRFIKNV